MVFIERGSLYATAKGAEGKGRRVCGRNRGVKCGLPCARLTARHPFHVFYFMYSFDYQFIYPLIMKRFNARIQWRDSIERTQRKGFK